MAQKALLLKKIHENAMNEASDWSNRKTYKLKKKSFEMTDYKPQYNGIQQASHSSIHPLVEKALLESDGDSMNTKWAKFQ